MKKVVIVTEKLVAGGIEKALIEMITHLPSNEFNITLLCMKEGGEFRQFIPEDIKVEKILQYDSLKDILNYIVKNKKINDLGKIAINFIKLKLNKHWIKQYIYSTKIQPRYEGKYDIAIAYSTPISKTIPYVINNINADKKAMWIHSDVELFKNEMKYYKEYYEKYYRIFCVSKEVKDKFIKIYPMLKCKTDIFYNIISKEKINNLANNSESFNDNFDGSRILTVGRLSAEKGYRLIPGILKRLISDGLNVKWYCIGDGWLKKDIEEKIEVNSLEDRLILLGTKVNPYGYMRDCDIYVQPSEYECYCTSVTEAKCLNKPIVFTNVNGSKEQITTGINGLITEYDEEKLYEAIKKLIEDNNLRNTILQNLSDENISTVNEINKLINII